MTDRDRLKVLVAEFLRANPEKQIRLTLDLVDEFISVDDFQEQVRLANELVEKVLAEERELKRIEELAGRPLSHFRPMD